MNLTVPTSSRQQVTRKEPGNLGDRRVVVLGGLLGGLWGSRCAMSDLRFTMGALRITYTILGVPYYKYGILGPKPYSNY